MAEADELVVKARAAFWWGLRRIEMCGVSEEDWIYQSIRDYRCFYEPDLLRYVEFALRRRKGLLVDVGANIGNHSVFFGAVMGRDVVSFEPRPDLARLLRRNLDQNHVRHRVFELGLGDSEGRFRVDADHEDAIDNAGATRIVPSDDGSIQVATLDSIMAELRPGPIAAIKADIEGMEPAMLRGALATLETHKPDLFVEISTEESMNEIEGILLPLGYERLHAFAGTPVWHFCHRDHLSKMHQLELAAFKKVMRATRVPMRYRPYLHRLKERLP